MFFRCHIIVLTTSAIAASSASAVPFEDLTFSQSLRSGVITTGSTNVSMSALEV